MIHYHGLPINPQTAAVHAIGGGHAFVTYADPQPLGLAIEACQSFAIDNGAFSAWMSGEPITDWTPFYAWVTGIYRIPHCDFIVIPDVIDGTEADNDRLLDEWPFGSFVGAPVWHLHESLERLGRMVREWPRICLGSSGQYATVGDAKWWGRMAQAMEVVCDDHGTPLVKLHGLRMLNPEVFTQLPFASADSTNIARNIGIDSAWNGTYRPPTKEARALLMRQRIESNQAATRWSFHPVQVQEELCL